MYLCSLQALTQTLLNTCVVLIQHFGNILLAKCHQDILCGNYFESSKGVVHKSWGSGAPGCCFNSFFLFKKKDFSYCSWSYNLFPFLLVSSLFKMLSLMSKCHLLEGPCLKCSSSYSLSLRGALRPLIPSEQSLPLPLFCFVRVSMLLCCYMEFLRVPSPEAVL